jgi:hypothetical protein
MLRMRKKIDIDHVNKITSEQEFILSIKAGRKKKLFDSISYEHHQIDDALTEINFILNCYENNAMWEQAIVAKQQDLLSNSAIISNLHELGSGIDRVLSDYVIIHLKNEIQSNDDYPQYIARFDGFQ